MSGNYINVNFCKLTVRRVRNVPTRHRSSAQNCSLWHTWPPFQVLIFTTPAGSSPCAFSRRKFVPRVSLYRKTDLIGVDSDSMRYRFFTTRQRYGSACDPTFSLIITTLKIRRLIIPQISREMQDCRSYNKAPSFTTGLQK